MGSPVAAEEEGEAREGRGEGGEWREKVSASEFDVGVDGAKSEIEVERMCGHELSAEDFFESVIEITVVSIDVIVNVGSSRVHRHARLQ